MCTLENTDLLWDKYTTISILTRDSLTVTMCLHLTWEILNSAKFQSSAFCKYGRNIIIHCKFCWCICFFNFAGFNSFSYKTLFRSATRVQMKEMFFISLQFRRLSLHWKKKSRILKLIISSLKSLSALLICPKWINLRKFNLHSTDHIPKFLQSTEKLWCQG